MSRKTRYEKKYIGFFIKYYPYGSSIEWKFGENECLRFVDVKQFVKRFEFENGGRCFSYCCQSGTRTNMDGKRHCVMYSNRELMLYSDFVSCAKHFLEISNSINDGWTLKTYKDHVYLVKSMTQCLSNEKVEELDELESLKIDFETDEQSADDPPLSFRKWEYHVLHNVSYQVPVIYFNVWKPSGQLLSLDEVWEAIHRNFQTGVLKNKWFTLTQQEHPYLFKPFFYFHPCQTEDFLNSFSNSKCNMLITLLSSIGQVIWLRLDSAYGKNCFLKEL